jgi:L-sorbose 1-phosphate reductase
VDTARLESLAVKARRVSGCHFEAIAAAEYEARAETHSYAAIMAPVPELVARAIAQAKQGTLINLFAGIPAPVCHPFDLDTYIEKECFLFGTSGSRLEDMLDVLESVRNGRLDTNLSVDAVSGMAGAIDGLGLVESRALAGKIVVYPELVGLGLVPIASMREQFPTVAAKLTNGTWNREAETELLRVAKDAP